MAKLNAPPEAFSRKDQLKVRRRVIVKEHRGQVITQKWPRPRGKTQSQLQQAWVDAFSDRARTLKSVNPAMLTMAQNLAKGTGWYYRDVLETGSYGKLLIERDEYRVTTPTVSAFATASTLIPQNVATPLPLTAQYWDNNAFRDPANPTRLVVKSPGLYLCIGNVNWTTLSGTTGHRQQLRVNNAMTIVEIDTPGTQTLPYRQNLFMAWYFHADDYLELYVQKNNANNQARIDMLALVAITPEALIP